MLQGGKRDAERGEKACRRCRRRTAGSPAIASPRRPCGGGTRRRRRASTGEDRRGADGVDDHQERDETIEGADRHGCWTWPMVQAHIISHERKRRGRQEGPAAGKQARSTPSSGRWRRCRRRVRRAGRGRLIFALDATASREPTWDRACRMQGEMFEATAGLGRPRRAAGVLSRLRRVQGEPVARPMPPALHRAMRAVTCVGGETQIARVLRSRHRQRSARRQGQRPGLRRRCDGGDRSTSSAAWPASWAARRAGFRVPRRRRPGAPRAAFQEIARLTRGAYCPFDAASAAAAARAPRRGRRLCRRRAARRSPITASATGGAALLLAQRVRANR